MVKQDVPDHEDAGSIIGHLDQDLSLFRGQGQRFLDVDVLACFEASPRELIVSCRGRRDRDRTDSGILENVVQLVGEYRRGGFLTEQVPARAFRVAYTAQDTQLREDASQVLSPMPAPNEGNTQTHFRSPFFPRDARLLLRVLA